FSGVELKLRFVGKILSDGIGTEVNAAGENFAFFEEQQVAGLCSDIQEHCAVFDVAVVIAESIAQGSRRNVGELKVQPGGFGDAEKSFNDVRLDGNEEDFQFTTGSRSENL